MQVRALKYFFFTFVEGEIYLKGAASHETPEPSLKLSKFCSLRHKYVKLINDMPHDVCCCIYHENFIECCSILNKNLAGFPSYGQERTQLLVCNPPTRSCWLKTCSNWLPEEVDKKLNDLLKVSKKSNKKVKWLQWVIDEKENRLQRFRWIKALRNWWPIWFKYTRSSCSIPS